MKPLVVLLVSFGVCYMLDQSYEADPRQCGRISMAVMLLFTALGHFKFSEGMSTMMPAFVPRKKALVILSGIVEVVIAVGLILPGLAYDAGWLAIVMFVLFLPVNVYASVRHVDHEKGTYDGPGPRYLWFRVPLQLFFIGWTYFSAIAGN